MKLATIAPPNALHVVSQLGYGYHFALGQELFRSGTYHDWFWHACARGGFLIVDNGAAEPEEERVPFESIAHAALDMGADEIILPDKLRDYEWTMEHSTAKEVLEMVPQNKRFIAPQGKNWREWMQCAVELVHLVRPVTIGIPKWTEELPGGRAHALKLLMSYDFHTSHNIHLLGVHSEPFHELIRAATVFRGIRGIDTGAPIAYAQNGQMIGDSKHFSLQWDRTVDTPGLLFANVSLYNDFAAHIAHLPSLKEEFDDAE